MELVAATWEVEVETHAGEQTPPPSAFHSVVLSQWRRGGKGQLKEDEQLVALYAYRFLGAWGRWTWR